MQMQELQIKQGELQLKQQKQQIDAATKADQIRIEESRIAAQKEIAAMQVGAQAAANKDRLEDNKRLKECVWALTLLNIAQIAVQQAAQGGAKPSPKPPNKENK
jgi:hypothetical protein